MAFQFDTVEKNMFKRIICKIERMVIGHTKSKDNYIVFESDYHHIFDNSFFLYKYLKKNKKLKLFYVVYNKDEIKEGIKKGISRTNLLFLDGKINFHAFKGSFKKIRTKVILRKCSLCFISYRNFYKEFNIHFYCDQTMVNLRHGHFPIKNVTNYHRGLLFDYDANVYFRGGSQQAIQLLSDESKNLKCKWFPGGMPRNDCLYNDKRANFKKFVGDEFDYNVTKFILCMTTFKGHASRPYFETQFPIKIDKSCFIKLQEVLQENDIVLLIKAHHDNALYDVDLKYNSRNIIIFDDTKLERNDLFINEIFQYTSALITDYSSVLFDYLYIDKPIGFAIGDLNTYKKERGFDTDYSRFICGPTFSSFDCMIDFILGIKNNNDKYKAKRDEIAKIFIGEKGTNNSEQIAKIFIRKEYLNT